MSDYSSDSSAARAPGNQRLDVPTLPPPSSRFVLPPPPSDLLNRLQAFLPQIRDANALLEQQQAAQPEGTPIEEPVVMEELSDSSSDEDDDDDDDEDEADDDDDDDDNDEDEDSSSVEGTKGYASGDAAGSANDEQVEKGSLAHLMDISSRSKVTKKNLVVEEHVSSPGPSADAAGERMQAD
ncbi:hypothetical protein JCM3774_002249 [Rhodotorula dairenensis]